MFKRWINLSMHWINLYLVENTIDVLSTCPLESDLSVGWRYVTFERYLSCKIFSCLVSL